MTWQPIATAPKDGAKILARDEGGDVEVVRFTEGGGWLVADEYGFFPVEWQPLPQ